jgi:DNA-3-methyladenine glycosylase II
VEKIDPALLERARRSLRRRDAALGGVIREVGPCLLRRRGDPYGSLLRSVLHQQLAGAAAKAIDGRFRGAFGGRYPRPEVLLGAPDAQLRQVGLSRQKSATLRGVARAFHQGDLCARRLHRMDDEAVIAELTTIKGIGTWTAHMLLIFSLGRPDVLPVGDYGVRKAAQRVYGLAGLPEPAELEQLAGCWRPYSSVASWYLWRALELPQP